MEKSNTIVNGIKLQDGRIIQGYRIQQDAVMEEAKGNHSIFRLDIHRDLTYLCAVTFKNNDYGKRKSKLPGGI